MKIRPQTPKQKFIFSAITFVIIVGIFLLGIITPLFIFVRNSSIELQDKMIEQVSGQAKFHDNQEQVKNLKAIQSRVNTIKNLFLTDDRDLSNTLNNIERLAKENNITLKTQLLAGTNESANLSLTANGTFLNVMDFVRRLEQFPKFNKIEGLNMASKVIPGQNNTTIQEVEGNISLVIYMLPTRENLLTPAKSKTAPAAGNSTEE